MKAAFRADEDFLSYSFIRRLCLLILYLLTKRLKNPILSEARQYYSMADGMLPGTVFQGKR